MTTVMFEDELNIHRWLDQLESSVVAADHALHHREWRELGEQIAHQRRYTHGLKNALALQPGLAGEEKKAVDERISGILARRAKQIHRLERFHSEVGRKLRELTQFKFALREMSPDVQAVLLNTQR